MKRFMRTIALTSEHMAAINKCSTLSEVNEYDYTTGYPQKLSFNVEDLT